MLDALRLAIVCLVALVVAPPGRESVIGAATAVDAAAHRLVLRTDAGGDVAVAWDEKTAFLRARPGASSLEGATPVTPAEITAGDRLFCRGTLDAAGATLAANRVVVMTRGDVEQRRAREQEDWRRRGLAGVVTAVDAGSHEITVRVPQASGVRSVVVEAAGPNVTYRRYAPASVRFSDAHASTFAEIAPGDQIRVLGNRSADGSRVAAEQLVSGAFRVVRGVVAEVDPAKGTLVVRESGRGGGLVPVTVAAGALVRRLPPMMVMRLLRPAEGAGAGGLGGAAAATQAAAGGNGAAATGPAAVGSRAPDPDEVLERLPAATLAQIQKGDEVAVLGPKQDAAAGLPAIKVAAWTVPSWPAGSGGGRGRGDAGQPSADPFSELLGVGGETSW